MSPAQKASSATGIERRVRPWATSERHSASGSRVRVCSHAAQVWAPSRAQSPEASKAPTARVSTASTRALSRCSSTNVSPSPRATGSISHSRSSSVVSTSNISLHHSTAL